MNPFLTQVRRAAARRLAPFFTNRRRATTLVAVAGGAAALLITVSCTSLQPLPKPHAVYDMRYLDQGWSRDDRRAYYHTPQGTQILRYEWLLALEHPLSEKPLFSNDVFSSYGFIPDPDPDDNNPDRLPVGVTKDIGDEPVDPRFDYEPGKKPAYFGLTCAACHTGQINYKGMGVRVDGGPGPLDLTKFVTVMFEALIVTDIDPLKFDRFAKKVLGENISDTTKREKLKAAVHAQAKQITEDNLRDKRMKLYPTADGFGRQDALGRGGNNGFSAIGIDSNLIVADAPVSYPAVWDAVNWDWIQYNTSIHQPLGRNVGEVLGVGAAAVLKITPEHPKADLYKSSVKLRELDQIEQLVRKLKAPRWSENVLGAIDRAKAQRGSELFKTLCAGCHGYQKEDPAHKGDYLARVIPLDEIGTDPKQAENLNNHMLDPGDLALPGDGNPPKISAGAALQRITQQVMEVKFKELNISKAEQDRMTYGRPNLWRATAPLSDAKGKPILDKDGKQVEGLAYRAHPLTGIWATAPYLHNGSVPNMAELLMPVAERSKVFYTGNFEYDPVNMGHESGNFEGGFEFKVSEAGNSNAGHEFRNPYRGPGMDKGVIGPAIDRKQREEIIEYLKTL